MTRARNWTEEEEEEDDDDDDDDDYETNWQKRGIKYRMEMIYILMMKENMF